MRFLRWLAAVPSGRRSKWLVLAAWLAVAGVAVIYSGKLFSAADNQAVNFLPRSSESTQVLQLEQQFQKAESLQLVVVYARSTGITAADQAMASRQRNEIAARFPSARGEPGRLVNSADGEALLYGFAIPLPGSGTGAAISSDVKTILSLTGEGGHGLDIKITGAGAATADVVRAFQGFNGKLLLLPLIVVAILLLLIYRSPWLWLAPLLVVGVADQLASAVVYLLTKHADLTLSSFSAGILGILVYGAGTDYALLLIARYREELLRFQDRHEAMRVALSRVRRPVTTSAVTVIIALLCLLSANQNSTHGLGPVGAVGIACVFLAMITLLPALLVICGRWLFWPRIPRPVPGRPHPERPGTAGVSSRSPWVRLGGYIDRRPKLVSVLTVVLLGVLGAGLAAIQLGLPAKDSLVHTPDSVKGQQLVAKHFPAGASAPVDLLTRSDRSPAVLRAVRGDRDVADVTPVVTRDHLAWFHVTLSAPPDTKAETTAIDQLRSTVHAVPGAGAVVGGGDAITLDLNRTNVRDAQVVIPVVLAVVLLMLGLMLRAIVAPIVLVLTVILSYAAAWGVGAAVFRYGLGFAGVDTSMPLVSFVFLVALGIDYNIFLMSRVHEEAQRTGTRTATLSSLAITGPVITSAGVVLAATFTVITVLPIVAYVELGFVVAFGVLLDTLIVRSVLVPALTLAIGPRIWWPSGLSRRGPRTAAVARQPAGRPASR